MKKRVTLDYFFRNMSENRPLCKGQNKSRRFDMRFQYKYSCGYAKLIIVEAETL